MKAKLIKIHNHFYLYNHENDFIAATENNPYQRLSMKNCQAIERGYDLDELAKFYSTMTVFIKNNELPSQQQIEDAEHISEISFKAGFQKAIELMDDKKFTLEDMMNCWNKALKFQEHKETLGEHIQSLQQKEWDVEVEIVPAMSNNGNVYYGDIPKLDENGFIILKRI